METILCINFVISLQKYECIEMKLNQIIKKSNEKKLYQLILTGIIEFSKNKNHLTAIHMWNNYQSDKNRFRKPQFILCA